MSAFTVPAASPKLPRNREATPFPMDPINSCFVSYRHTGDPGGDKFVQVFVAQLQKQLNLWMPGVPVFFDKEGLKVGDLYNQELAYELCRSACMVLVFSPLYFDVRHPYCALEYRAMLELEQKRLRQAVGLSKEGLIFPVVFRGLDDLPGEIKGHRNYETFAHIATESQFRRRDCQERLQALAEEIWKRYRDLINARVFLQDDCQQFRFPDEAQVLTWLEGVAPLRVNMPGH